LANSPWKTETTSAHVAFDQMDKGLPYGGPVFHGDLIASLVGQVCRRRFSPMHVNGVVVGLQASGEWKSIIFLFGLAHVSDSDYVPVSRVNR
jgi:hypothetical protein